MELVRLHDLPTLIHEPDGPRGLQPCVREHVERGKHDEPARVVLHVVLQEGGDTDVDVLEEVEYGVSHGLQLAHRHGGIVGHHVVESGLNVVVHVGVRHVAKYRIKMIECQGDDMSGIVAH